MEIFIIAALVVIVLFVSAKKKPKEKKHWKGFGGEQKKDAGDKAGPGGPEKK